MNETKIRLFEIMNDCDKLDINAIIKWLDGINCKYLAVKHDKDLPRAPHYHIFVRMKDARKVSDIARLCGVKEQYINYIKSWKNALAYAFHMTAKSQQDGKYKYDDNAVISAVGVDLEQVFDTAQSYDDKRDYEESVQRMFYDYGNCLISKNELLKRISVEDFHKYHTLFRNMQEYRIMKVRDRQMQVIYISGGSSSGKTTFAKFMARCFNYDVFISGSGADILDGYDKEECIILDDLRGDVFKKNELFKLTDNNTNSSVKSRFKNKDISYCRLMIITSVKSPMDLYDWTTETLENKDETFKQFARRIGDEYIYIGDDGNIYHKKLYQDEFTDEWRVETVKDKQYTIKDVFTVLGIELTLGKELMNKLFAKVAETVQNELKNKEEQTETKVETFKI